MCWLLERTIRFITVFVAFYVLQLSVISVNGFVSGTKTSNVLRLKESHPLRDFLFIIMFCFTRSVIMSARASLVMLGAVVLVMRRWGGGGLSGRLGSRYRIQPFQGFS